MPSPLLDFNLSGLDSERIPAARTTGLYSNHPDGDQLLDSTMSMSKPDPIPSIFCWIRTLISNFSSMIANRAVDPAIQFGTGICHDALRSAITSEKRLEPAVSSLDFRDLDPLHFYSVW
jgi:hypothetical protein